MFLNLESFEKLLRTIFIHINAHLVLSLVCMTEEHLFDENVHIYDNEGTVCSHVILSVSNTQYLPDQVLIFMESDDNKN